MYNWNVRVLFKLENVLKIFLEELLSQSGVHNLIDQLFIVFFLRWSYQVLILRDRFSFKVVSLDVLKKQVL